MMVSGFVYANKEIHCGSFFFGRFCRIMIPAYVYATIIFVCSAIFYEGPSVKDILIHIFNLQGIQNVVPCIDYYGFPRLGILWFLTAIMMCYLLLPLLKKAEKKFNLGLRGHSLLLIALVSLQIALAYVDIQLFYLLMFYIGYYLGKYIHRLRNFHAIFIYAFTLAINGARLVLSNRIDGTVFYNMTIATLAEGMVALAILITLYLIYKNWPKIVERVANNKLLRLTDKYSMAVYIVHFTFFRGIAPATLITSNKILALLLMIGLTLICLYPFQKICDLLDHAVRALCNRKQKG
ncbi:MAG: acyltransferase [Ruminococcaceae bacterium]|nr:acyltransferase [Oscillospiraceae bacterium]